jgi:glycosyltransferase involved in cell wall biosynthesis
MAGAGEPTIAASNGNSAAPGVLYVLDRLEGGSARATLEFAAALKRAGGRPVLAAAGGGRMTHEIGRLGADLLELPLDRDGILRRRRSARQLAAAIRARGLGLVHVRAPGPVKTAALAAKLAGVPWLVTLHEAPPKRMLPAKLAGEAALLTAVSETAARDFADFPRLRLIPHGVDTTVFDSDAVPASRIVSLATAWRLPDDGRVVTVPGRLKSGRAYDVILDALARLGRDDVVCLFLGEEEEPGQAQAIERLAKQFGVAGRVHVAGRCADMPAAYMLSDVVLSPALDGEGFPLALIEAQAMGRPLVAPDDGVYRELIAPGITGWLAQPGVAESYAEALDKALALDGTDRATLARAARGRAVARYALGTATGVQLALYAELAAENRAAAA